MVLKRGLEPLQAYCPLDPEPSVSTNFTTSALDEKFDLPIIESRKNYFVGESYQIK